MQAITSSHLQLFAYDLQIKLMNAVNMASVQDLYTRSMELDANSPSSTLVGTAANQSMECLGQCRKLT